MTPDQERWAEALQIEQWKGQDGPRWIAERIIALAIANDDAGVQRFREIAIRYHQLLAMRHTDQAPHSGPSSSG